MPAAHPFANAHDHASCLDEARRRVSRAFERHGLKLTPLRRLVFEEIAASHDAVGAYEILDRLVRKTGERMAPVSVYRAIGALIDTGVVHRLESRNAFFACHGAHAGERPVALVCEACGAVSEVDGAGIHTAIGSDVANLGFTVTSAVVEITGRCAACNAARGTRA